MQVLFPVSFISSSGLLILSAQIVHINEGGDKLVLSTTKSNFSLSHLPVLVIDILFLSYYHHHTTFLWFSALPPTHCGHYIDPTSKQRRLYMDLTSTPHRPHIVPSSTPSRPYIGATKTSHPSFVSKQIRE